MREVKLSITILFMMVMGFYEVTAQSKPKKNIKKQKLVLSITDSGLGIRLEAIKPIAAYLSKELKMEVVVDSAKGEVELLEDIKSGKATMGYSNNFSYVLAMADSAPVSLLVVPGNKAGKPDSYNSCIISAKSKNINSMEELIENAANYNLMFVNPTSTSGHLVPRLYFMKLGIPQVEAEFKEISFGEDHYSTIHKVLKGEADAGAVAYNILQILISKGKVDANELNVLWVSEDIPQTPLVVNKNLDLKIQARITKALLEVHEKDPKLWKQIQFHFSARNATNYIPAKDEYYDAIRNVSGRIEDLLFILNFYLD